MTRSLAFLFLGLIVLLAESHIQDFSLMIKRDNHKFYLRTNILAFLLSSSVMYWKGLIAYMEQLLEQILEEIMQLSEKLSNGDLETIISFVALLVAIISLLSQTFLQYKLIRNNTATNHFSTLVELYRIGRLYTSNINGFNSETNELIIQIQNQISLEDFKELYQSPKFIQLRNAISYFDFLQKLIQDGSLRKEDCYCMVTFPISLFRNMQQIVSYAQKNAIRDMDNFGKFCDGYIEYMKEKTGLR